MRCFIYLHIFLHVCLSMVLEITVPLTDTYVFLGKPFWWKCGGKGDDPSRPLTYHWRLNDADIELERNGVSSLDNGTLHFEQVREEDLGYYTCVINNGRSALETGAFLRKAYASEVISRKPSEQTVPLGKNAKFHCYVDARPDASITWFHNDQEIVVKDGIETLHDEPGHFILQLMDVSYSQSGVYKCLVHHDMLSQPIPSGLMNLEVIGQPIITHDLGPVTSPAGYNITLSCPVESNPTANVIWTFKTTSKVLPHQPVAMVTKDNSPVSIGHSILSLNENGLIRIVNTTEEISGEYACQWSNNHGSAKSNSSLEIGGNPQAPILMTSPDDVDLVESSELRLPCIGRGNPSVSVSWRLPDSGTAMAGEHMVGVDGIFAITNVRREDSGTYQCIIKNSEGVITTNVTVNVLFEPYFVSGPTNLTVVVEKSSIIKIPCVAGGNPQPDITWKLPWSQDEFPAVLLNSIGDVTFQDGYLSILVADSGHHGEYKCIATNEAGVNSMTWKVKVVRRPVIAKSPTSVGVVEGDEALLECRVNCYPPATVDWYHKYMPDPSIEAANLQDAMSVVSSESINFTANGMVKIDLPSTSDKPKFLSYNRIIDDENIFLLNIIDIGESDAGIYVCRVENERGSNHSFGVVRVITFPYFNTVPRGRTVLPGDDVTLHCQSSGIPVPTQRWLYNGGKMSLTSRFVVYTNGSLFISQIKENEFGNYTCLANNQAGQRSVSANLLKSSKPYLTISPSNQSLAEAQSGSLGCSGISELSFFVSWYTSDRYGKRIDLIGEIIVENKQQFGDDTTIDDGKRQNKTIRVINNGSLVFECVEKSQETWYVCQLKNEDGLTKSEPAFLHVESLPRVISLTTATDPKDGDTVDIMCVVNGPTDSKISWISPQKVEISTEGSSFLPEIAMDNRVDTADRQRLISVLTIAGVRNRHHGGDWWCKSCLSAVCTATKTSLVVRGNPVVQDISVTTYGTQIHIECLPLGVPIPRVTYFVNNTRITNETTAQSLANQTLVMDTGFSSTDISCVATNDHGTDTLVIDVPSKVTIIKITPGQVDLQVELKSEMFLPHASLTGVILEYKSNLNDEWGSVEIEIAIKNDWMTYFKVFRDVKPKNDDKPCGSGVIKKDLAFAMGVLQKLSVESTGHNLTYSFQSSISGLESHTVYLVRAKTLNGLGVSSPSEILQSLTLSSAPSTISNVQVSISNRSCSLTWNNPIKLNGRPQYIVIQISLFYNSSSKPVVVVDSQTIPVTKSPVAVFLNLSVGPYSAQFTPFNTNIMVSGERTDFSFHVQDQPPHFVPKIVEIRSITSNTFKVIWEIPNNPATLIPPVTGYVLNIQSTGVGSRSVKIHVVGGETSQFIVNNLHENEEYKATVASKNEAGSGQYSNPMRVTTRYSAFSEKALGSSDLGYSISWKLIAIIIISLSTAVLFFVAFLVFSYQFRLSRSCSIDITSESTDVPNSQNKQELPDIEGISNSNFLLY